jgi:hypothetical protein
MVKGESDFVKPDICHFQVSFPPQAKRGARLELKLIKRSNSKVYASVSESPTDLFYNLTSLSNGDTIKVDYPFKIYFFGHATSYLRADIIYQYRWEQVETYAEDEDP